MNHKKDNILIVVKTRDNILNKISAIDNQKKNKAIFDKSYFGILLQKRNLFKLKTI